MTNRVFSKYPTSDIQAFSTFSAFTETIPFKGPSIKEVLEKAKKQSFLDGYKLGIDKGCDLALNGMEKIVTRKMDDYILLNTRIVDFVQREIKGKFKNEKFKLVETRANFFKFLEDSIDIVFIIETDMENIKWFSSLLIGLEKEVLEKENSIAELRCLNKKDKEVNCELLASDYPFVRSFK